LNYHQNTNLPEWAQAEFQQNTGSNYGPSYTNYNNQDGTNYGSYGGGSLPSWAHAGQGHTGNNYGPSYTNYNAQGASQYGTSRNYGPSHTNYNTGNTGFTGQSNPGHYGPSYTNYNTQTPNSQYGGGYQQGSNLPSWAHASQGHTGNYYGPSHTNYNTGYPQHGNQSLPSWTQGGQTSHYGPSHTNYNTGGYHYGSGYGSSTVPVWAQAGHGHQGNFGNQGPSYTNYNTQQGYGR